MPLTDRPSGIERIHVGGGRIVLNRFGGVATFSELSSTYPLKLLSPRVAEENIGVVYVLTYGGGLVGGDHVNLDIDVGDNAFLVMLTQGSTKVFKTRVGDRLSLLPSQGAHSSEGPKLTEQIMNYKVAPGAALFLLPETVTCFRSAAYNQVQTFHLSNTSSAVVLDWITSGRKSLGEEWAFSRYYSVNDVWVDGKRVAKDVLLLDENSADVPILRFRTLQEKLAPYSCFAMVLLFGPLVQSTISSLTARYASIAVFKQARPEKLIWAISPTHTGSSTPGAVLRVAGVEAEDVKLWLKDALKQVEPLIGIDTYRRAFNS